MPSGAFGQPLTPIMAMQRRVPAKLRKRHTVHMRWCSGVPRPLSRMSGKRKALVVGINYEGMPNNRLKGCINDAMRSYEWLQTRGFDKRNIQLLTDHTKVRPTKWNMIRANKSLVRGAQPGDSLFFHFSGHGITGLIDKSGDESDGFDEAIMVLDDVIVDDYLYKILVHPLPPFCRLSVIMDCCHSGTALDLPLVYDPLSGIFLRSEAGQAKCDVVCLSASNDGQIAGDQELADGKVSGILTEAFQRAMLRSKSSTLGELFEHTSYTVRTEGAPLNNGQPQTLVLSVSHNFDMSSPYLV